MEVVHYVVYTGFLPHDGGVISCFYIPKKQIILSLDSLGNYSLNDNEGSLKKAQEIRKGNIPESDKNRFQDIKTFEYDEQKIQLLIENVRLGIDLEGRIINSMNELRSQ